MVIFVQPSPKGRTLSATEAHVFEERDPACHIWSQVVANPEDVLFDVGKKLDAELSFHGDGPPDYILFGEEHGVSLGFNEDDGTLKRTRGVYVKRHE